jgi:hypothetical protein
VANRTVAVVGIAGVHAARSNRMWILWLATDADDVVNVVAVPKLDVGEACTTLASTTEVVVVGVPEIVHVW